MWINSGPAMKKIDNFTHEWIFDLPWHMVNIKDWFYMINVGYIEPTTFLHVRVLGMRSLWTFQIEEQDYIDRLLRGEVE